MALALSWLLLLAVLLPSAGCNDDHPIIPFPESRLSSPDEVVDAFQSALESRDIEALVSLFDHETEYFSFPFQEDDVTRLSLPAGGMGMEDMIQVWRNVFSGQDILNNEGEVVPGITGIEVVQFYRNTDWCGNECDPDSWLDLESQHPKSCLSGQADDYPVRWAPAFAHRRQSGNECQAAEFRGWLHGGLEDFALFRIIDGTWNYDWEGMVTLGEFAYRYFYQRTAGSDVDGGHLCERSASSGWNRLRLPRRGHVSLADRSGRDLV